jgi:preprotein translocase subunit YajC
MKKISEFLKLKPRDQVILITGVKATINFWIDSKKTKLNITENKTGIKRTINLELIKEIFLIT